MVLIKQVNNNAGAIAFKLKAARGSCSQLAAIQSLAKYKLKAQATPITTKTVSVTKKMRLLAAVSPFFSCSAISLETAKGIPAVERAKSMEYTG